MYSIARTANIIKNHGKTNFVSIILFHRTFNFFGFTLLFVYVIFLSVLGLKKDVELKEEKFYFR